MPQNIDSGARNYNFTNFLLVSSINNKNQLQLGMRP